MRKHNTFSLVYFLRKERTNEKKEAAIYLRITINGKETELATKQYIDPNKWDSKARRAKGRRQEISELNVFLDTFRAKAQKYYNDLMLNDEYISPIVLKNRLFGIDEKQKTLIETFEYHNQLIGKSINSDFAPATITRYKTTLQHIKNFILFQYKKEDINLKELNYSFVANLDQYFKIECGCCHNTSIKYIKNLKKVVNLAINNEWLQSDPFANFKTKLEKTDIEHLTEVELKKIEKKELPIVRLAELRDAFVFACYTGMAYIDVANATPNILDYSDSDFIWIKYERNKTGVESIVPLLPKTLEIIEKYKNHPEVVSKGSLLPISSNQKTNAYLKELATICGIEKNLTFHMARHTFATTVSLLNGMSLEATGAMLGHADYRSTQIYAKTREAKVKREMTVVRDLLNKKTVNDTINN